MGVWVYILLASPHPLVVRDTTPEMLLCSERLRYDLVSGDLRFIRNHKTPESSAVPMYNVGFYRTIV